MDRSAIQDKVLYYPKHTDVNQVDIWEESYNS